MVDDELDRYARQHGWIDDDADEYRFPVRVYVRHLPPDGEIDDLATIALATTEYHIPGDVAVQLACRELSFDEAKNPVYALEAFHIAHNAGIYPPRWVLDWLQEGISECLASNGEIGLDRALQIRLKNGKGKEPPFKSARRKSHQQDLMLEMWRLNLLFGISITKAAEMVARRLESAQSEHADLKLRGYTPESLEALYYRKWSKFFADAPDSARKALLAMPGREKRTYLDCYPRDCLPSDLK